MKRQTLELIQRLNALGFDNDEALKLRRISMTLSRWNELECGDGNNYGSWAITRGRKVKGVFTYDEDARRFALHRETLGLERLGHSFNLYARSRNLRLNPMTTQVSADTRQNRRQRVRIPWLLSYLENMNKAPHKAQRATMRANLADILMAASEPKTRERL